MNRELKGTVALKVHGIPRAESGKSVQLFTIENNGVWSSPIWFPRKYIELVKFHTDDDYILKLPLWLYVKIFHGEKGKTDPIVESVKNQFSQRSAVGIEKYGTTLEENNNDDFKQHLKEELMDAILYLEKLQSLENN